MKAANDNIGLVFECHFPKAFRTIDFLPATTDSVGETDQERSLLESLMVLYNTRYIDIYIHLSGLCEATGIADPLDDFEMANQQRVDVIKQIFPNDYDCLNQEHHVLVRMGLDKAVQHGVFNAIEREWIAAELNLGVWQ